METRDALHLLWNAQNHLYAHYPYPKSPSSADAMAVELLRYLEKDLRREIRSLSHGFRPGDNPLFCTVCDHHYSTPAHYDGAERIARAAEAEKIHRANLERVSSPAYRRAERSVARAERSIRREASR